MTREEAIMVLEMVDAYGLADEAKKMAITALQAEPIKVITDDTIEVRYTDFEDIGRIILTNGDIFCKMFYEDNTQEDDDNYDSLIPDEYKTEPSDLISRADAIEAVRESCGGIAHSLTDILSNMTVYKKAKAKLQALPSADRPTKPILVKTNMILNNEDFERLRLQLIAQNKNIVLLPAGVKECDRPSGEWLVDIDNMTIKCNKCQEVFRFDDIDEMIDYKEYAKYCINCGARMENENE